jgi:hypothetical protein
MRRKRRRDHKSRRRSAFAFAQWAIEESIRLPEEDNDIRVQWAIEELNLAPHAYQAH